MEVYAGFLAHTDAQVGRLIAELEELGIFDDTLFIYITGDNGSSAEGTEHGAWSAPAFQNGLPEDPEWLLEHIDDFGSVNCENHFNAAWAWALDAPFQWMKQVASHFGATRNGMALSWPNQIHANAELRTQFHHIIDIAPTILEAAGIVEPTEVNGVTQHPMEGVPMGYSFASAMAPSTHVTQYFEILGNRALYHDGWIACCFHGRVPWIRSQAVAFDDDHETWELYDIRSDFSQAVDLADRFPEKLAELKVLFEKQAERYGVYPLSDQTLLRALPFNRPSLVEGVTTASFFADTVRMPELAVINFKNASFHLDARISVGDEGARGVLISQGGAMAGWAVYFNDDGRAVYVYNYFGRVITSVVGTEPVAPGEHVVTLDFTYDGGGLGKGGDVVLRVDGVEVATGRLEATVPFLFSMSGETLDVGVSTGSSVGPYPAISRFSGTVERIDVELLSDLNDELTEAFGAGQASGALAQQ
jgi:arylsulfatase